MSANAPAGAGSSRFSGGGSTGLIGYHSKTGDDDDAQPSTSGRPQQQLEALAEWKPPCIVNALGSGAAAGVIGYIFGFLPSMFQNRQLSSFGKWKADAASSASAFFLMSGVYTFASCLSERIRQKDDGWNRAVAGFSSGAVVQWKNGAAAALQSGALIAAVSYFMGDVGTAVTHPPAANAQAWPAAEAEVSGQQPGAAHAAAASGSADSASCCRVGLGAALQQRGASTGACSRSGQHYAVRWSPGARGPAHASHGVAWLAPIFNTAYFDPPSVACRLELAP